MNRQPSKTPEKKPPEPEAPKPTPKPSAQEPPAPAAKPVPAKKGMIDMRQCFMWTLIVNVVAYFVHY